MQLTKFRFNLVAATLAASAFVAACGGGSAGAPALTAQATLVAVATPASVNTAATSALTTTGGSGAGAVTYAIASGTCTVAGATLTAPATAGTCTVTATKAADATYAAATSAAVTVTVTAVVVPSTTIATLSEAGATMVGFGTGTAASIVTDPADATNKIVQVIKTTAGETWAGATINTCGAGKLGTVPTLPLDATNKTMTLRVKSPTAGVKMRLKLEDNADATKSVETDATITAANTWETLTFNFANQATGTAALNIAYTFNKASVFPNFGAQETGTDKTYFFDDLKFIGSSSVSLTCPNAPLAGVPSTAAPAPTAAAANVVSIFSDAYTSTAGIQYPNWGQTTVITTPAIVLNPTQKYTNFNYQGIDFAANPVNVSTHTSLHIDLWSADATSVDVFIISIPAGGAAVEQAVNVPLTASTWKHMDIPMTSYTTPDKTAIKQIKLVSSTPAGVATTVYMDNLYFWK